MAACSDDDDCGVTVQNGPREVVMSCENVHKTYLLGLEGVPALRGVSLDVYKGEFCVIYGNSGGGKTTLLNILGTIDTPTKGNLAIMGKRLTSRTPDSDLADLRLNTMGFVFQTFNLLSTLTAAENVAVPLVLNGQLSMSERKERVRQLLESVGMGDRMDHYPSMLSGGEQQRVTIARAMANNPQVLLLDEPTGDLDTRNTKIVLDVLLRLNRENGVTLVMVTHDPELKWFAHRAVYVQDGRIGNIEKIPPNRNGRAFLELQQYLNKVGVGGAGLEPGGLESTARAHETTGNTEVRYPQDYATFCEEGLRLRHGNTIFGQIFNRCSSAGGHSAAAQSVISANRDVTVDVEGPCAPPGRSPLAPPPQE